MSQKWGQVQQLAEQPRELTLTQEIRQASGTLTQAKRGRPSGSIGRRSLEAREIAASVGLEPLSFLLRVAKNRRIDIQTRVRAAQATLVHLYPKLAVSQIEQTVDASREFQKVQIIASQPGMAELIETLVMKMIEVTPEQTHDAMFTEPAALLPEAVSEPEPEDSDSDAEDVKLFGEGE